MKKYEYRMQYFVSELDNGIFSAMNKGIRKASGTYLLFMNGGDVFYNNEVISQIYPYLEDEKAEVYYGDSFRLFDKKEDCFVKTYPDDLQKSFFYIIKHRGYYSFRYRLWRVLCLILEMNH